jgi:single-strand DNA-binding protein
MNIIAIIGHLGKDPETRYTSSGKAVCKFSVAITSRKKDGSKHTEWVDVVAWEKLAEICEKYLSKGKKVAVEGSWKKGSWEHEGKTYYKVECLARSVEFLSSGQDEQAAPGGDDEPPPF